LVHNLNERVDLNPILVHKPGEAALSSGWLSKKSPKCLEQRFFSEPWFGSCIF